MTKNQALFAAHLQVHGKRTSKEHTTMHLLHTTKTKVLNKQGSYQGLQTARGPINMRGNTLFWKMVDCRGWFLDTHTHTQEHINTDLKRSRSVGICRWETKEQTTGSLCFLRSFGGGGVGYVIYNMLYNVLFLYRIQPCIHECVYNRNVKETDSLWNVQ